MSSSGAPILRRKRPLQYTASSSRNPIRSPLSNDEFQQSREEPFGKTLFKVGSVVLLVCAVFYHFSTPSSTTWDEDYHRAIIRQQRLKTVPPRIKQEDADKVDTLPLLPTLDLALSKRDAFGISETYLSKELDPNKARGDYGVIHEFLVEARKLRQDFSDRYGGEQSARALLQRSLRVLTANETISELDGVIQLASKIQRAREKGEFKMAFSGQSAAAGYGNHHQQAYSYVVERLLSKPFGLMGLKLSVQNGAIHDIPTFPYIWCQDNHLGDDLDFVSWDFGPTPRESLEAYIRHIIAEHPSAVLMFRDSLQAEERQRLIQKYADAGLLTEPFAVDAQQAMTPYANVKERVLPTGFQNWNEFGGPPGAPGKNRQNLSVQQHEVVGYVVAMHFLSALELVAANSLDPNSVSFPETKERPMPPPFSNEISESMEKSEWHDKVYRYGRAEASQFKCRTLFDPVFSGSLSDVVVSGSVGHAVDLLHPKGAILYHQGWPIDLDTQDRREKQLMKQYDNLGFRDYKKSFHGIKASGPLRLFLPSDKGRDTSDVRHLIVCESHATSGKSECNLQEDVSFTIGGVKVPKVEWIDSDAASHLGRPLCVYMSVPEGALMSEGRDAIVKQDRHEDQRRLAHAERGLALDIEVTRGSLVWNKGPCSVAQVIWVSEPRTLEE